VQRSFVARIDDVIVCAILEQVPDDFFMLRIGGSMESGGTIAGLGIDVFPSVDQNAHPVKIPEVCSRLERRHWKVVMSSEKFGKTVWRSKRYVQIFILSPIVVTPPLVEARDSVPFVYGFCGFFHLETRLCLRKVTF
jgi:hypothetical protein